MPINVELLQQTLAHIEEHEDEWDQIEWRCGTTMCFAGHAVSIRGAVWVNDVDPDEPTYEVAMPDGTKGFVEKVAQQLLGLDYEQALELFYDTETSIVELRRRVASLVATAEFEKQMKGSAA